MEGFFLIYIQIKENIMIYDGKYLLVDGDTAIKLEQHLVECLTQIGDVNLLTRKSLLLRHYQGLQGAMLWDISLVTTAIQSQGFALLAPDQAGRILGVLTSLRAYLEIQDEEWLFKLQDTVYLASLRNKQLAKDASIASTQTVMSEKTPSTTKKIPVYKANFV